ncbi:GCN5-related N-acetyltransferase [Ferroglobus placidus DSM 10642]|uniref:GCN5-related N-acetyltransferase n=1 Tax=Ferroglobus placidus (strain DSM 10642 / AEDII12DO) TaxID=589924 RepID=D3RYJ1_FERPA|nr:GNAT family N-acetyltransferase [Ferroglobus placidus]ADC65554.1 GCN5-related N-acetyltransferase [Ferroglobus placidus DSM 10642]
MNFPKKVKIANGEEITLRFPKKDDLEKLIRMYTTLSENSLRFLRPYEFSKEEVKKMFERVDFENVYSVVAENEKGEIVAESRLIKVSENSAELAVIVHDSYQNKKLGQTLAREMIEFAKSRGFKRLIAFINERNRAALHIFEKLGFKVEARSYLEPSIMGKSGAALKLVLQI